MIALVSIVFSMVLSGVVSYYDSLEIIKNSTMVESEYIRSGIEQQADYLSHISSAGYGTGAQSVRVTLVEADGSVSCDSVADVDSMVNPGDRP